MVDKVRPIKIENTTDGSQDDAGEYTELNPAEDYLAAKGIAFENSNDYLFEKLGTHLTDKVPDYITTPIYDVTDTDLIVAVEYLRSTVRFIRVDLTYTSGNVTTEEIKIYDSNGTTILRTSTFTYTYSGSKVTSVSRVET